MEASISNFLGWFQGQLLSHVSGPQGFRVTCQLHLWFMWFQSCLRFDLLKRQQFYLSFFYGVNFQYILFCVFFQVHSKFKWKTQRALIFLPSLCTQCVLCQYSLPHLPRHKIPTKKAACATFATISVPAPVHHHHVYSLHWCTLMFCILTF